MIHGIAWVREFVAAITPMWKHPGEHLCFVFVITDNTHTQLHGPHPDPPPMTLSIHIHQTIGGRGRGGRGRRKPILAIWQVSGLVVL